MNELASWLDGSTSSLAVNFPGLCSSDYRRRKCAVWRGEARRAAKLPVLGSVRGSVCAGNSSGPVCLDLRGGAPSSGGPLHLLRLHGGCGDCGAPAVRRPALGRHWRRIRSPLPAGADSPSPAGETVAGSAVPNHGISHKLNQHPQTRVLRCGELFPGCHQRGLFFFFFVRSAFLGKAEFSELSFLPELTERP